MANRALTLDDCDVGELLADIQTLTAAVWAEGDMRAAGRASGINVRLHHLARRLNISLPNGALSEVGHHTFPAGCLCPRCAP